MNTFDNSQLRSKIDMYLDNALPQEDEQGFFHQLNNDPSCSKLLSQEQTFRNYIKENLKRPSVSSDLIQTIKDRLR